MYSEEIPELVPPMWFPRGKPDWCLTNVVTVDICTSICCPVMKNVPACLIWFEYVDDFLQE